MRLRANTDAGITTEQGLPKATSEKTRTGKGEGTKAGYYYNRFLCPHDPGRKKDKATWQASEQTSPETSAPEGEQKPAEETSEATRTHPREGYSRRGRPSETGGRHGQT